MLNGGDTLQQDELVASLQRALGALGNIVALRQAAAEIMEVVRTLAVGQRCLLLAGDTASVVRIATALSSAGEKDRAAKLLISTGGMMTALDETSVFEVISAIGSDARTLFRFAKAANNHCTTLEALGFDEATLVDVLRQGPLDDSAADEDVLFALNNVPGGKPRALLALALGLCPTSARLWEILGDRMLDTENAAEAARAYEHQMELLHPDPGSVERIRIDAKRLAYELALETPVSQAATTTSDLPRAISSPLVKLAILYGEQHGAAAAREVVARYANRVPVSEAALAYLRAGAGADAIRILVRELRVSPTSPDRWTTLSTLARVYSVLGMPVTAVAAVRALWPWPEQADFVAYVILGFHPNPPRHPRLGIFARLLPRLSVEEVRALAIDQLVAATAPAPADREEAARSLEALEAGPLEQRATEFATLRRLGADISRAVLECRKRSESGMASHLGALLEEWAWEFAENRFRSATGLTTRLPGEEDELINERLSEATRSRDLAFDVRSRIREAVQFLLEFDVTRACAVVESVCDLSPDLEHAIDTVAVGDLAVLLVAHNEVSLAGRLLRATVRDPDTLRRFRATIVADKEANFDAAFARSDWFAVHAFGLTDEDIVAIATARLDLRRLSLEETLWLFNEMASHLHPPLIRPALRCYPRSPTLCFYAGATLLERDRPRAALRLFERSAALRREARRARHAANDESVVDDPDVRGSVFPRAVQILAGYPPLESRRDDRSASENGVRFEAAMWQPLLVNIAVLRYQIDGRPAALEAVRSFSEGESAIAKAASLRALGEIEAATHSLERHVFGRGEILNDRGLTGLIALYAGAERIHDAIVVATMAFGDYKEAKAHIDMLISLIIDQCSDDLTPEVLEYERRFMIEPAEEAAIDRLVRRHPTRDCSAEAKAFAESLNGGDLGERARALSEIRALGPPVSGSLLQALPLLEASSHTKVRGWLEQWAWDAEVAEARLRLSSIP